MNNDPKNIRDRVMEFALSVIKYFRMLNRRHDDVSIILGKQLLKSATSIGANIEEAQAAESRADFIHKYSIAQKEARETFYWLQLLQKADCNHTEEIIPLLQEVNELISIITVIILNTKKKNCNTQ